MFKTSKANNLGQILLSLISVLTVGLCAQAGKLGDPRKPGGDGTTRTDSLEAFSLVAKNIKSVNKVKFHVGRSFFRQNWITAPASVQSLEGLGPTFIAQSCIACHDHDGRGRPPQDEKEEFRAVLFRLSLPGAGSHGEPLGLPNYGDQIQNFAITGVKPEGKPHVDWKEIKGNYTSGEAYTLSSPVYSFRELAYGSFPEGTMVSPRSAQAVYGLGLLESISEKDILAQADPEDKDGDGISGRVNHVWDVKAGKTVLGRFGWKANQPHLRQQTAGAFSGDMGITSSIFPNQNCPSVQKECLEAHAKSTLEISDKDFETLNTYLQLVSVPARRDLPEDVAVKGERLMKDLQCLKCHTPSYKTSADAEFVENRNQWIYPYTDLLLHDMGEELADHRPDFEASGLEWRTPPLWGLGLVKKINNHTRFLHDGRARSTEEAILWHGGEAQNSRDKFKNLSRDDRSTLIQYVESL